MLNCQNLKHMKKLIPKGLIQTKFLHSYLLPGVAITCVLFVWSHLLEAGEEQRSKKYIKRSSPFRQKGFYEITLLGQNVDSYLWYGGD